MKGQLKGFKQKLKNKMKGTFMENNPLKYHNHTTLDLFNEVTRKENTDQLKLALFGF
jgi:hypothetical protein